MNQMWTLIKQFPQQLSEAIHIGKNSNIHGSQEWIKNVVVSGLGGSGIGGNLVGELAGNQLKVPFLVNKDYHLPAFADKHTLVIISSYSGNTEETISALEEALQRQAKIVTISSGGHIQQIAQQYQLDHITIPGGHPPRACLGYSVVQQLYILHKIGLIDQHFESELLDAIDLLLSEQHVIMTMAKELAQQLHNKIPILYCTAGYESVAVRFRQQLNENAKMLCWHHVIPEMNHNELVGWRKQSAQWAVVFLRNEDDFPRNQKRIEINKQIIAQYTPCLYEIWSKGKSKTERSFYLIHLADWISFFLAELNRVDVTEVQVIDYLKKELAKE